MVNPNTEHYYKTSGRTTPSVNDQSKADKDDLASISEDDRPKSRRSDYAPPAFAKPENYKSGSGSDVESPPKKSTVGTNTSESGGKKSTATNTTSRRGNPTKNTNKPYYQPYSKQSKPKIYHKSNIDYSSAASSEANSRSLSPQNRNYGCLLYTSPSPRDRG